MGIRRWIEDYCNIQDGARCGNNSRMLVINASSILDFPVALNLSLYAIIPCKL